MPLAAIDAVASPKKTYAVHTDHLNRPIMLTDSAKTNVWWARYEPFGRVHATGGTLTQNLGLPGQWFQLENGLAYNWHRHYDPTTGRYTTADPLGFVDGPSVFAYAGSAPHEAIDPSGLWRWNGGNRGGPFGRFPSNYNEFGRPYLEFSRPNNLRPGGTGPVARGQQGETAVRNSCSIGDSVTITINGRNRRPDGIRPDTLTEIKNQQYTPFTRQLRDYSDYARQENLRMDLFLPPGGRVSGPLQNAIDSGAINPRVIPFPNGP
jgi:RHS repeat-associated protein